MDTLRHKKHMQWKQNRKDIYYFIVKYTNRNGNPPPTRIISEELDISRSTVQRHLRQFGEDGLVEFCGTGSHRTYQLTGGNRDEAL